MRKRRGLWFVAVLMVVLVGLSASGCEQKEAAPSQATVNPAVANSRLTKIIKDKKIRVGWASWAPAAYRDPATGKVTGSDIFLIELLAKSLGVEVEYVETNWNLIVTGLLADQYDITVLLGRTLSRAQQVAFTQPVYGSAYTFVVKKDAPYKSCKELDVKGNKIAVTQGSNTEEVLMNVIRSAEIVRLKDTGAAVLEVQTGRAQAAATLREYFEQHMNEWPDLRIMDDNFGVSLYAFAIQPGDQIFLNYLNQFITDLKANGLIDKMIADWNLKGVVKLDIMD